jgi:hypothetical protein
MNALDKPTPYVCVGEEEWIPTDRVEFVDISEDIHGRDIMTFIYKGKQRQSYIITKISS